MTNNDFIILPAVLLFVLNILACQYVDQEAPHCLCIGKVQGSDLPLKKMMAKCILM